MRYIEKKTSQVLFVVNLMSNEFPFLDTNFPMTSISFRLSLDFKYENETKSDNFDNHLDFPIKLTNQKPRYIRRRDMFIANSSAVGKIITIDILW